MAVNNPFLDNVELDESTSLVHLLDTLSDYDIDENAINLTNSYYVDELTFISTLQNFENGLSIISLNIQSIRAKFDELQLFIDNVSRSSNISIIYLQETWLSDNCSTYLYQIRGYTLLSRGQSCTAHGGLIIYVHNSLNSTVMKTDYVMTNWECLTVEVSSPELV